MGDSCAASDGDEAAFRRVLERAGIDAGMIRTIANNPYVADSVVRAFRFSPAFGLEHGLFTGIGRQIAAVRSWNAERRWGFSEDEFRKVAEQAPVWPRSRLATVVLVPYLDSVQATFDELWPLASSAMDESWRRPELLSDPQHLWLIDGATHQRGLRWEAFDLGANHKRPPLLVRSAATSPHAGILAAAALHPEWVRRMDGDAVPYVWLAGYEAALAAGFGIGRQKYMPTLTFDGYVRKIRLDARWYDFKKWCSPLCGSGWGQGSLCAPHFCESSRLRWSVPAYL